MNSSTPIRALAALDGSTRVYCAHEYTEDNLRFAWYLEPDNGALEKRIARVLQARRRGECTVPSTIDEERATNPFLRQHSPSLRATLDREFPDRDLSEDHEIFAATRELKDLRTYKYTALPGQ